MTGLPSVFTAEMQQLFARFGFRHEWPAFIASFSQPAAAGLRANTLKIPAGKLSSVLPIQDGVIKPVPWSSDGFYLPSGFRPGRLPGHSAGLFYIQEPSAMLPAVVLNAKPGERILDLCAAPGGKSTKIAADLQGEGLLWANEISAERTKALLHNIERIGCRNSIITQETPERMAALLPEYFDAVLVDAPCSGSGMFRRDPEARESWLQFDRLHYAGLQRGILRSAWAMLRPGGRLVYSTCTFSLAENEEVIAWMLETYPDCRIQPISKPEGVDDGLPLTTEMSGTARIWPHRTMGDGHFCALLVKAERDDRAEVKSVDPEVWEKSNVDESWETKAAREAFDLFIAETLAVDRLSLFVAAMNRGTLRYDRGRLHLLTAGIQVPVGLRKVKTGLFLGQTRRLRGQRVVFEPSHAFLMSLTASDFSRTASGSSDSDLIRRYLRGETTINPGLTMSESGYYGAVLLKYGEHLWPLGWMKTMPGNQMKNLYPQAWLRLI
ncbi:MAG: RsmB/NOP family class I SAM-dependent RNA methyltransferase [Saccharofermentanales bacterium]